MSGCFYKQVLVGSTGFDEGYHITLYIVHLNKLSDDFLVFPGVACVSCMYVCVSINMFWLDLPLHVCVGVSINKF